MILTDEKIQHVMGSIFYFSKKELKKFKTLCSQHLKVQAINRIKIFLKRLSKKRTYKNIKTKLTKNIEITY